jgi:hypothetical protein
MKFNIKEWQDKHVNRINEIHSASGSKEYNKLVKLLQAAVKQAEMVGKDAQKNRDEYEGSEGADVSVFLEEIWAGFSTGNHKDKSENDEIFK